MRQRVRLADRRAVAAPGRRPRAGATAAPGSAPPAAGAGIGVGLLRPGPGRDRRGWRARCRRPAAPARATSRPMAAGRNQSTLIPRRASRSTPRLASAFIDDHGPVAALDLPGQVAWSCRSSPGPPRTSGRRVGPVRPRRRCGGTGPGSGRASKSRILIAAHAVEVAGDVALGPMPAKTGWLGSAGSTRQLDRAQAAPVDEPVRSVPGWCSRSMWSDDDGVGGRWPAGPRASGSTRRRRDAVA